MSSFLCKFYNLFYILLPFYENFYKALAINETI